MDMTRTCAFIVLRAIALLSCGDYNSVDSANEATVTNPTPEVDYTVDVFHLRVTNVTNMSATFGRTWLNTGTSARVTLSSSIGAGTATLMIRDPSGAKVSTVNLNENGSFTMSGGAPGNWKIEVRTWNVTGTLNFFVERGD
jgi:hypothetical protein